MSVRIIDCPVNVMLIAWDWVDKDACADNGGPSVTKHTAARASRRAIFSRRSAGPDLRVDFISISPQAVPLGSGVISILSLTATRRGCRAQAFLASTAASLHRETEGASDWDGSLRRLVFSGPGASP